MGKNISGPSTKLNETEGFQCLEHSNWTICSPLSPLVLKHFHLLPLLLGTPFLLPLRANYPKREFFQPKREWDRGFSVPGAFKLDHLQSIEPILFQKIFNFFTFILGGQFLLPQRANNWKNGITQLKNWMRGATLSALGIQNGLFAAL